MCCQAHDPIVRSFTSDRTDHTRRVTYPAAISPLDARPPMVVCLWLLHREHGHGLSVGLDTGEDDEEVPDAKDQDPAHHDEEVYPMVTPRALPELACTRVELS